MAVLLSSDGQRESGIKPPKTIIVQHAGPQRRKEVVLARLGEAHCCAPDLEYQNTIEKCLLLIFGFAREFSPQIQLPSDAAQVASDFSNCLSIAFKALRRRTLDAIYTCGRLSLPESAGLVIPLQVEAAAPVPRCDDRRRPILFKEELPDRLLVEGRLQHEDAIIAPTPSRIGVTVVPVFADEAQNPEGLQVAHQGLRCAARERLLDGHRSTSPPLSLDPALPLARQSATRSNASRYARRNRPSSSRNFNIRVSQLDPVSSFSPSSM